MHYGEEKSNNAFEGESVGFVHGCIDAGDDYILDIVAELKLDAQPETNVCSRCDGDGCDHDRHCDDGIRRSKGRGFVGPDAEQAADALASVRESHVAQAVGRWARNPDDPDDRATVYVATDATPEGFVDHQVPGVERVRGDGERRVMNALETLGSATTAKIADDAVLSEQNTRHHLNRFADKGIVNRHRFGSTVEWEDVSLSETFAPGVVDLDHESC
ncbi:hypothetical protein BRC90_10815 [Halobacteriales archaeon QS_4_69_34]|nr:MAG: hypothetical protein BRC90_10815 [Halobacteriales archaeon QS_4_69_34]